MSIMNKNYELILTRGIIKYLKDGNEYFEYCLGRLTKISEEAIKKSFKKTII